MTTNRHIKCVSFLVTLLIIFNCISSVAASGSYIEVTADEYIEYGEPVGLLEDTDTPIFFFGIGSTTFADSYYDQLDSESQAVYNTIYKEYNNAAKSGTIKLPLSKTFANRTVSRNGNTLVLSDADNAEISSWIVSAIRPAIFALIYDHPELCWLIGVGYMYGRSTNGIAFPSGATSVVTDVTISSVTFALSAVYTDTGDKSAMDSAIENAKAEIDQTLTKTDSQSVLKAIHDYVCNTVTYTDDSDLTKRLYQTPYSAFYGDKETVCAGYAKSFKLLCEAYDIPCILVSGTGNGGAHMWNYVKLDGSWYAVDTTWDDQSEILYDYFLVGGTTVDTHFSKQSFSASHIASGMWASDASFVFTYPTLSSSEYVHTHTITFVETIAPTASSPGLASHYACSVCDKLFSNESGETEVTSTSLKLVYCDVNLDKRVNTSDIVNLKKILAGSAKKTATSDINGDNKVTSIDIIKLKKRISKVS